LLLLPAFAGVVVVIRLIDWKKSRERDQEEKRWLFFYRSLDFS